jgi:anti-anti-sigma regulatory factor
MHALTGDVTIYTVGTLKGELLDWIERLPKGKRGEKLYGSPLPVDASAVNEVDAAGLQLLVALSKSLSGRFRPLQLVNPSAPLVSACQALGLGTALLAPDDGKSG